MLNSTPYYGRVRVIIHLEFGQNSMKKGSCFSLEYMLLISQCFSVLLLVAAKVIQAFVIVSPETMTEAGHSL